MPAGAAGIGEPLPLADRAGQVVGQRRYLFICVDPGDGLGDGLGDRFPGPLPGVGKGAPTARLPATLRVAEFGRNPFVFVVQLCGPLELLGIAGTVALGGQVLEAREQLRPRRVIEHRVARFQLDRAVRPPRREGDEFAGVEGTRIRRGALDEDCDVAQSTAVLDSSPLPTPLL